MSTTQKGSKAKIKWALSSLTFFTALVVIFFALVRYQVNFYTTEIMLDNRPLYVDVVQSAKERQQGLSGREGLEDDQGMLFVLDERATSGIWMLDMKFVIDVIWLNDQKRIISIEQNISPDTYPQTFQPEGEAKYIIEVDAGYVSRNNIQIGDRASFNVQ